MCAKPVGAICFEDLEATPIEPPPTEKDVAPFASFAFSLDPTPGPAAAWSITSGLFGRIRISWPTELRRTTGLGVGSSDASGGPEMMSDAFGDSICSAYDVGPSSLRAAAPALSARWALDAPASDA